MFCCDETRRDETRRDERMEGFAFVVEMRKGKKGEGIRKERKKGW